MEAVDHLGAVGCFVIIQYIIWFSRCLIGAVGDIKVNQHDALI